MTYRSLKGLCHEEVALLKLLLEICEKARAAGQRFKHLNFSLSNTAMDCASVLLLESSESLLSLESCMLKECVTMSEKSDEQ